MREDVGAKRRIERKSVHAVPRAVNKQSRRTIEHVTGRHLLCPALQHVGLRIALAHPRSFAAKDREDRADAYVDVDVARAVERVEDHHVLAVTWIAECDHWRIVLLRRDNADIAPISQAP